VVSPEGRVGITKGGTPSTHILKTPIDRLPDTVANEAFCLHLGRHLGIDAVHAVPGRALGREYLLVERYDRRTGADGIERLHQEDFCQALGIPSDRKYEVEGGPSLADGFALIRRCAAVPAREAVKLLDYVMLSFLVGNHDAHGKNYSLLYLPDNAGAVLAPQHDVLSTIAYDKVQPMSRKMAMRIGGEYRPRYVRARHVDRMLEEAGLGPAAARRRLRTLAERAPMAADETRQALADTGWDADVLERIIDVISQRASSMSEIASPRRPRRRL
jgi:serine/threonine-protein kinase HipA